VSHSTNTTNSRRESWGLIVWPATEHGFEKPWRFDYLQIALVDGSIADIDDDVAMPFNPSQVMDFYWGR
jgi:hypothetical protein